MAQEVSWKSLDLKSQENEMGVAAFVSITAELQRLVAGLGDLVQEGQVERLARSVSLILEEAEESMTQLGIQPVPGVGQAYNPSWHHIVEQRPGPPEHEGIVVEVMRQGYRKREATVAVAKALVAVGVCSS